MSQHSKASSSSVLPSQVESSFIRQEIGGVRRKSQSFSTFLPSDSVNVRQAAIMDGLQGSDAMELWRSQGNLTLEEIASMSAVERGSKLGARSMVLPESDCEVEYVTELAELDCTLDHSKRVAVRRAVGHSDNVFDSPAFDDSFSFEAWLRQGGEIVLRDDYVKSLRNGDIEGGQIMILAYGAQYVRDGSIGLNSGGMAARAARFVFARRGVRANEASLLDAAASAAAAAWAFHEGQSLNEDGTFSPLDYLSTHKGRGKRDLVWDNSAAAAAFILAQVLACGGVPSVFVPSVINSISALCWRAFAAVCWRSAFNSLTNDGREGRTGRKAAQVTMSVSLDTPLSSGGNSVGDDSPSATIDSIKSLQAWFAQGGNSLQDKVSPTADTRQVKRVSTEHKQKRFAVRWLKTQLGASRLKGASRRAKTSQARKWRQWVFLSWVILGASAARAARAAQFSDEFSAFESLRSDKVLPKLKASALSLPSAHELELQADIRRAASWARAAWLDVQYVSGCVLLHPAGHKAIVPSAVEIARARRISRAKGIARLSFNRPAVKVSPSASLAGDTFSAWSSARAAAVQSFNSDCVRVQALQRALLRARAFRLHNWDKVANGLRNGERAQRRANKAA